MDEVDRVPKAPNPPGGLKPAGAGAGAAMQSSESPKSARRIETSMGILLLLRAVGVPKAPNPPGGLKPLG